MCRRLLRLNFVYPESRLDGLLQRWLTSRRHRIWAVSTAVRNWASGYYGVPTASIAVIYPGHDWQRYQRPSDGARERLRVALNIRPDVPVILLVGRLKLDEKGQDIMLRAMPAIIARHPDTVLVLAGDGPDRAACEALVDQLRLTQCTRLIGHRSDVPDLMCMADIVTAPSTCEEAFGLVALEAQAADRPVVVSGSGGLCELVDDGRTGLIAGTGDTRRLAACVLRLLDAPELVAHLVRNGLANAPAYGLDAHMDRVTAICEQMVDAART